MKKKTKKELILQTIKERSSVKQDVYHTTKAVFSEFKEVLKDLITELRPLITEIDSRIIVEYNDKGDFDAEIKIAGDILLFQMHTNVFEFDKTHLIWKNTYVKKNEENSFCGMISVYNFLNDSFKFNRLNDIGYLINRIFVNHDRHFFTEGKPQVSITHNNFGESVFDKAAMRSILETTILFCLNFDLFVPPYENVQQVTLHDIQSQTNNILIQTGKRLGFKFQGEDEVKPNPPGFIQDSNN